MEKLKLVFENCYGIKSLTHEFDFTSSRTHSIYAPNGSMKTSFSKTFSDYSKSIASKDAVFDERINKREIIDETGVPIPMESIFVIEPYNQDYNSEKTSLLLVNPEIKSKYDEALDKIDIQRKEVVKELQQLSGLTGRTITPESEIARLFNVKSILDILEHIPKCTSSIPIEKLGAISYNSLFNDKVIAFLNNSDVQKEIAEYINKYEALITQSPILNKKFNHVQAQNVQKSLFDSGFFDAKHNVGLYDAKTGQRDEYASAKDMADRILTEKQKILNNNELEKKFDSLDKKMGNAELRALRDYLEENKEVLVELDDIPKLQMNIFVSYFKKLEIKMQELTTIYKENKSIIEDAVKKAKEEKTRWEEVVTTFKQRFSVPFDVSIENQEDVILKQTTPKLNFTFNENTESKNLDKNTLLNVLSQGEKRALYLMNILFEINARKRQKQTTLMIIDDIADSFDYKNKYAIIEYLREITENPLFLTIFLTHNYDFHRTIGGRLDIARDYRYMVLKNDINVIIKPEEYQNNPFEYWKKHLDESRFLLSSVPFVRNLAEYCGDTNVFIFLTSFLHIKSNTEQLTIQDIEDNFKKMLKDKSALVLPNRTTLYKDVLFQEADKIMVEGNEKMELESKIILAIAIRLYAEKYMIKKINDQSFVDAIKSNQTIKLYKKFISIYPSNLEETKILDEVNIMTPENIHINSFMFEPILDMSPINLKELYGKVKNLSGS
ncbi:hypothetical protein FACS1894110_07260 [Spirochaetia bacterium]|nr:hypothetical protein FACS1894110_07260 [Spirochaetia bacterium]